MTKKAEAEEASQTTPVNINLTLEIENYYEEIDPITTRVEVNIPPPPDDVEEDSDEYQDWVDDNILPHTGTGHTTGDSSYWVKVIETDSPDIPVGTEYSWGG
jgi:hypothetical protein